MEPEARPWVLPRWPRYDDLTQWFEQTAWWDTAALTRTPQRALVELLEAIAGRFTGHELTVRMRARGVRLRLDDVRVRARETPDVTTDPIGWFRETSGVRELVRWTRRAVGLTAAGEPADVAPVDLVALDATDVEIDGLAVGRVAARVVGVRLEPKLPLPELVTGPIELDVHTTRERLLAWVRRDLGWDVAGWRDGLVALRLSKPRPLRSVRLLLRPTLRGRVLRTETVGAVVLGRELRFPRRFVTVRERRVTAPDPALELVDAVVDGDDVTVRLRHGGVRRALRLDELRAVIRDGATVLSDALLG